MSDTRTWVLTDVDNGIYVEEAHITGEALGKGFGQGWEVTKRRMKGGLSDGVDVIDINNGRMTFTVVPTRGMGFWRGEVDGFRIGWNSPAKRPVHPSHINLLEQGGLGWLKGFNECIVRCGLNSNGAPGMDRVRDNNGNIAETMLSLHGNIANIPAHYVEVSVVPGAKPKLIVKGVMEEARCFCPQYRFTVTYTTEVGSDKLSFNDHTENFANSPTEFMLLYHCNFGEPFVWKDSKFVAPVLEVAPRDARAQEDIDTWDVYRGYVPGYVEQCYFMDLAAGKDGKTMSMLRTAKGDKAVVLRWPKAQLPHFCLWKHTAGEEEGYVTGMEPATNFPNQKVFERENGRVVTLQPGETYDCDIELQVAMKRDDVAAAEKQIAALMGRRKCKVNQKPVAKWSQM